MKNLSNVNIHEFLSMCEYSKVEGRSFEYEGKTYAIPYSTVKINNVLIRGLRENEERIKLLEKLFNKYSKSRNSYLDIGCNLGVFVKSFDEIFKTTKGVDADSSYIEKCKFLYPENANNFKIKDLNKERLVDFLENKVDVVSALSMIEYIDDKQQFVEDLYKITNELCIVEGHSEDIIKGYDKVYEALLKTQNWEVIRIKEVTDVGINAPISTKEHGRVVWICKK